MGGKKNSPCLSLSLSPRPRYYLLRKHTGHLELGPDEIEAKGIKLQGAPVYLDAQVRE